MEEEKLRPGWSKGKGKRATDLQISNSTWQRDHAHATHRRKINPDWNHPSFSDSATMSRKTSPLSSPHVIQPTSPKRRAGLPYGKQVACIVMLHEHRFDNDLLAHGAMYTFHPSNFERVRHELQDSLY